MFHLEKNIRTGTRYYCHNCGRNYNRRNNLLRHLNLECGVPKKFSCSMCSKAFARNNELKKHLLFVHSVYQVPNS